MEEFWILTCTLLPPIPKELILILSARSVGMGVRTVGTFKLYSENKTKTIVTHCIHDMETVGILTLWIGIIEFDIRRNGCLLQCQNRFDQGRYARRAF